MKKLLTLVTAAMLFTGAFAHDGKDCKGKKCTKAEMANCPKGEKKECCKKGSTTTTAKATKVVAKKA
jgi:hypothetical protein